MSIVDIIQKLKIQANALGRGIHPDYVLIERKDLEQLLQAYEDATKHQTGSTDSVWSKLPPEFVHDLESRNVEEGRKLYQQDFPKCEHRWIQTGLSYFTHYPKNPQEANAQCVDCGAHCRVHLSEVTKDCEVNQFSSRMCEAGTKGCLVQHKTQAFEQATCKHVFTEPMEGRDLDECLLCGKDKKENYIERGTNAFTATIPEITREVVASLESPPVDTCDHDWHNDGAGKCVCNKCGTTGRYFCGGEILPGAEYVPPNLDQDWEPTKPIAPCLGMTAAQMDVLAESIIKDPGAALRIDYPDMTGTPTVQYIPIRAKEAADCNHDWIQQPHSHTMRCQHCSATRSES